MNVDTTSLSLQGKYKASKKSEIRMTLGYSKDNRPDLPQLILSLGLSGQASIPFWMNLHSGNESDKDILPQTIEKIEKFKKGLSLDPDSVYVADSALYSRKFLLGPGGNTKWISRVPESIKLSREILERPRDEEVWEKHGDLEFTSIVKTYEGVKQRWILVFHKKASGKEQATLKKKLLKESSFLKKIIKKSDKKIFRDKREIKEFIHRLQINHSHFTFSYDSYPKWKHLNKGNIKRELEVLDIKQNNKSFNTHNLH